MGIFLDLSGFSIRSCAQCWSSLWLAWSENPFGWSLSSNSCLHSHTSRNLLTPNLGGGNQLVLSWLKARFLVFKFPISVLFWFALFGAWLAMEVAFQEEFSSNFGAWFLAWSPSWCYLCQSWTCRSRAIPYICHSRNEWLFLEQYPRLP